MWGESGCYLAVVILGEPYEITDVYVDKNGNFLWFIEIQENHSLDGCQFQM